MRKIVNLQNPKNEIKRLMIYNDEYGTYLFGFKKVTDCSSEWDEFYESELEAMEICEDKYRIDPSDWNEIPNPEKFCQHDWINPVRIKGLDKSTPEYGKFEKLVNGEWIEFTLAE